jgi:hypothetical protein
LRMRFWLFPMKSPKSAVPVTAPVFS